MTSIWVLFSLTTPFFPTFSRPASNCGLINATIKGPEGNIEYLVHLKKRPEEEARIVESVDIRGTVDAAFDTLAKKDPAEEKK